MAKTPEGKAISRRNAFKHGAKSSETCTVRRWLKGLRHLTKQFQMNRSEEVPSTCDISNGTKEK